MFKKSFLKLLLVSSFIVPQFSSIKKAEAMGSGPFEGLKSFSKKVTLGIETPGSSGS